MIEVNHAPAISGLSFRHFMGLSDYANITAIITASEAADQNERNMSVDGGRKNRWQCTCSGILVNYYRIGDDRVLVVL
jgi:hypothetical protein